MMKGKHIARGISALLVGVFVWTALPSPYAEAADLELSGWIPYWSKSGGVRDARKHLDELDMIHPFGYAVKSDGELLDLAEIKKSPWTRLFRDARKEDVEIVPTVMWSNTTAMREILNNPDKREDHINEIMRVVKKQKYDGIDIDYEGKSADTKDGYSAFLRELKKELGKKILSCTIESRTPPDSLYRNIPADIQYANDLVVIADVCDRVNIMAYDQQRADIKLNDGKKGTPYAPVSDADWVRKVLTLMLQTIPKEKVMLGVATYGHEYEIVVSPDWYQQYAKVRALNIPALEKLAKTYRVKPSRNSAGEMSFTYFPNKNAPQLSTAVPSNTPSGNKVAAQTLAYVNQTRMPAIVYYASWSDAEAIEQKIELAEEFGIRGIAMFKIDGQEDKKIWDLF